MSLAEVRGCLAMAVAVLLTTAAAHAQSSAIEDAYRGKTLQVVVGYAPGGGFDQYARLVAEFLPHYLPGHPHAVVQNMPGSSSIVATHNILRVLPKDGTVIGIPNHNLFLDQVLGRPVVDFDMTQFAWLGRLGTRLSVGIVWKKTGVASLAEARSKEIVLAGSGTTGGADLLPAVLNKLLGTRFRAVKGYPGQTEMYLAMERGEADGMASAVWEDLKSGAQSPWREKNLINILYVVSATRSPELPQVDALPELAANSEDRAILEIMAAADTIGRAFYVAPDVAADRVAALRAAFDGMLRDPGLAREAAKRNVEIAPMAGEKLAAFLRKVIATPASTVTRLRTILGSS